MTHARTRILTTALGVAALHPFAHAVDLIDTLTVRQQSDLPQVTVASNGSDYTGVVGDTQLPFQLELAARCSAGSHYSFPWFADQGAPRLYISADNEPDPYWNVEYFHDFAGNQAKLKRTWSTGKNWTANTNLPREFYEAEAVQACRDLRDELRGNGLSDADIFAADRQVPIRSGATARLTFDCTSVVQNLFGIISGAAITDMGVDAEPLELVANCAASGVPESPGELFEPFTVHSVWAAVTPDDYVGFCPKDIRFVGGFETNGPGKVRYRFVGDGGFATPVQELTVPAAGAWNVSAERTVDFGADTYTDYIEALEPLDLDEQDPQQGLYWNVPPAGSPKDIRLSAKKVDRIRLQIIGPYKTESDDIWYHAQCQEPVALQPVFPGPAIVVEPVPQFPLSDIAARGDLTIGTSSTPWGGEMTVHATEASARGRGVCSFRFRYDYVNLRGHDTKQPFANRLLSQNGTLDDTDGLSLYAWGSDTASGLIELEPGIHQLRLFLDADQAEFEANEANNAYSATVIVEGSCD